MKETEIRDRIRGAFGESSYPPDLVHRVGSHLGNAPRVQRRPQLLGMVAFIIAIAIIVTLVFVRMQSGARPRPAVTPPGNPSPPNLTVAPRGHIPQADLDAAQLSSAGDLITPFDVTSTSDGRAVTLLGAYADSARTVLFFRTLPARAGLQVLLYDDSGFMNASSVAGPGSFGDEFHILNMGPRVGSDGLAHLRIEIPLIQIFGQNSIQTEHGDWTFSFALRPGGATALTLSPPLTSLGSWNFTIEALDATSTQIHFQAVIDGATVEDIKQDTVVLLDPSGHPVAPVTYSAGTTVPKSQIGSTPPRNTRVDAAWPRPAAAGTYVLAIAGGGLQYRGTIDVPAPSSTKPVKGGGGSVFLPTMYPSSSERLVMAGTFPATITTANPSECGHGSGPDRIEIYAFGLWFQVGQAWYLMTFETDKSVGPYKGPGVYTVKANLYPYVAATGIADPIFTGTVQLTIGNDRYPGPQTGMVSGTLTWTGASTQPYAVEVSGSWTCMASLETGPA